MKIETVTITPAIASELLKRNTNNRNVKKQKIALYVHDIMNNNWKLNGESIKVCKDGVILDGQHRLISVVKANKSITTLLITDLERNVLSTIDTGAARTGGDLLNMNGVKSGNSIAAGINKYFALQNGRGGIMRLTTTNSDIIIEYNSNPDYYNNLLSLGNRYYNKWHRIITMSDFIAYYAHFNTKYTEDIVEEFFESILNGKGIGRLLYDKLLSNTLSKRSMSSYEKNALVVKAFIYHVNGKLPKQLKIGARESILSI